MLDSVPNPFDECKEVLKKNMKLDPHFVEFYDWAKDHNVPIVVLSSGMKPIISGLFESLLGHKPDNLSIVSNDVESRDGRDINTPRGWQIKYHDDSHFGHDKSLEIKPYAALPEGERPILLYAGDGVSDLSAAAETDLLFAKKGRGKYLLLSSLHYFILQPSARLTRIEDLVTYCEREGMPFTIFEDWSSILETTKAIYEGKVSLKKVAEEGLDKLHSGANEK